FVANCSAPSTRTQWTELVVQSRVTETWLGINTFADAAGKIRFCHVPGSDQLPLRTACAVTALIGTSASAAADRSTESSSRDSRASSRSRAEQLFFCREWGDWQRRLISSSSDKSAVLVTGTGLPKTAPSSEITASAWTPVPVSSNESGG